MRVLVGPRNVFLNFLAVRDLGQHHSRLLRRTARDAKMARIFGATGAYQTLAFRVLLLLQKLILLSLSLRGIEFGLHRPRL